MVVQKIYFEDIKESDLQMLSGGNAWGNAVLGGLFGLEVGLKWCPRLGHVAAVGVCVAATTGAGAYLGYYAN